MDGPEGECSMAEEEGRLTHGGDDLILDWLRVLEVARVMGERVEGARHPFDRKDVNACVYQLNVFVPLFEMGLSTEQRNRLWAAEGDSLAAQVLAKIKSA